MNIINYFIFFKSGFFNDECIEPTQSKPGYYLAELKENRGIKHEFKQCSHACLTCINSTICNQCENSYTLSAKHECIKPCEPGYFSNTYDTCSPCSDPCQTCLNDTYCQTCKSNKFILDGECLNECPFGYYSNSNLECIKCYPSCETCNGSKKNNCLTCNIGFIKQQIDHNNNNNNNSNTECLSQCPDGTYYDSFTGECNICNTNNCSSCIQTASTCTKCFSPYVLDETTFQCKQCCSRSIHGKLKANACCYCSDTLPGLCSSIIADKFSTYLFGAISIRQDISTKLISFFSVIFICLSILLLFIAGLSLRKTIKFNSSTARYATVQYTPVLNET